MKSVKRDSMAQKARTKTEVTDSEPTGLVSPPPVRLVRAHTNHFGDASRAEFVYRNVRDAIQDAVYSQGTRVREEAVAHDLGVSRTPVREALRRLEYHGLLEHAPGR